MRRKMNIYKLTVCNKCTKGPTVYMTFLVLYAWFSKLDFKTSNKALDLALEFVQDHVCT